MTGIELRHRAASFVGPEAEELTVKETSEPCLPGEDRDNYLVASKIQKWTRLAELVEFVVVQLEGGAKDLRPLATAIANHDSAIETIFYRYCSPSGPLVERFLLEHNACVERVAARGIVAVNALYTKFDGLLMELERAASGVEDLRRSFDTTETPPSDIRNLLLRSSAEFDRWKSESASYALVSVGIKRVRWDPAERLTRIAHHAQSVELWASISELDQLRFEYAEKSIPCPLPDRFSQGRHSTYFSNSALNQGTYSWAIIPEPMLQIVDSIYVEMRDRGYRVQLNSFYRNPIHNANIGGGLRSQHQYGRAVDFQVFDFDASGTVDQSDWELLRALIAAQSPTYIEPIGESGVGHVHAQWSNIAL